MKALKQLENVTRTVKYIGPWAKKCCELCGPTLLGITAFKARSLPPPVRFTRELVHFTLSTLRLNRVEQEVDAIFGSTAGARFPDQDRKA